MNQKQDGKLYGFYRGIVEDNNDIEKRGRVRVRIWGLHTDKKTKTLTDGIPTDELTWAAPALPIMEGGISGFGMFGVPVQGSHVMIFFENGHLSRPIYFASLPGNPTEAPNRKQGFNDPNGTYPSRLNEPDWHRLARGVKGNTLISTKNSLRDTIEPPSPANPEYPHNWVITTHGGITIELDSTPNNERFHIYHPSNSYIEIDKEGTMVIRSQKNSYEVVIGNKKKHVKGDEDDLVDGDLSITVTGDVTVKGETINLN